MNMLSMYQHVVSNVKVFEYVREVVVVAVAVVGAEATNDRSTVDNNEASDEEDSHVALKIALA